MFAHFKIKSARTRLLFSRIVTQVTRNSRAKLLFIGVSGNQKKFYSVTNGKVETATLRLKYREWSHSNSEVKKCIHTKELKEFYIKKIIPNFGAFI